MKEIYVCEICNKDFNDKWSAEHCEKNHLRWFLHELNRHEKIAKQLGYILLKKYDAPKDEYIWVWIKQSE